MVPEQDAALDIQADDYWCSDAELGAAATWTFAGRTGLERLSGPFDVTAPDANRFQAQLTRVQLDHVAFEVFRATAHRTARVEHHLRTHPTPLVTLLFVLEGRLELEQRGERFEVAAGEHVVADSRESSAHTASGDVRLFKSVIGHEHVPQALDRSPVASAGALQSTPLTESFTAFAASVLRRAASGRPARGERLVRAVADLQSSVLAEAQQSTFRPIGSAGLRARMEQYIEVHYADLELTPATLAAAFTVSLRQAHAVFDDEDRTIARFIRDRRVTAVARELRMRREPVALTYLAREHGFSSLDVLGRAFRQRYGMTPSEYREGGHRRFG